MNEISRKRLRWRVLWLIAAIALVGPGTASTSEATTADGEPGSEFMIRAYSTDSGGGTSTGGSFRLFGSIGQPDVGRSTGGNFSVSGGLMASRRPLVPAVTMMTGVTPTTLPEPGGAAEIDILVENVGEEAVILFGLEDDSGTVDGRGTCQLPQPLAVGAAYGCRYVATFTGNADDSPALNLTAEASGPTETVGDQSMVAVVLTDVLPDIALIKTAEPTTLPAPGGSVTFSVSIHNIGGAEPATITTLVDDVHGNLDGRGTCDVPQNLPVSGMYACSFTADVLGPPGWVEVDTINAVAGDDEGNQDSASDTAMVTLSDVLTDLSIEKTDGLAWIAAEESLIYTLRIDNLGTESVTGVEIWDPLPAMLEACQWSCTDASGGCGSGAGDVSVSVDLAAAEQAVVTVSCQVVEDASGALINTATVAAPTGYEDTDPSNNTATDSTRIGAPFFWDDFESGDLGAWTSTFGEEQP